MLLGLFIEERNGSLQAIPFKVILKLFKLLRCFIFSEECLSFNKISLKWLWIINGSCSVWFFVFFFFEIRSWKSMTLTTVSIIEVIPKRTRITIPLYWVSVSSYSSIFMAFWKMLKQILSKMHKPKNHG